MNRDYTSITRGKLINVDAELEGRRGKRAALLCEFHLSSAPSPIFGSADDLDMRQIMYAAESIDASPRIFRHIQSLSNTILISLLSARHGHVVR